MDESLICRLMNVRSIAASRLPKQDLQTIEDAIEAIKQLELQEEGAKEAFGAVVQDKRTLEKEVQRLTGLLAGAHQIIREYANGQRLPNPKLSRASSASD